MLIQAIPMATQISLQRKEKAKERPRPTSLLKRKQEKAKKGNQNAFLELSTKIHEMENA